VEVPVDLVSRHDKISMNLERRIGKNFHKVLRNHEYGKSYTCVVGEIDRYMEKVVKTPHGIKTYAYVFETKSRHHPAAYIKALNQLHRAHKKYKRCKKADTVFLYYVTGPGLNVKCVGVYDK